MRDVFQSGVTDESGKGLADAKIEIFKAGTATLATIYPENNNIVGLMAGDLSVSVYGTGTDTITVTVTITGTFTVTFFGKQKVISLTATGSYDVIAAGTHTLNGSVVSAISVRVPGTIAGTLLIPIYVDAVLQRSQLTGYLTINSDGVIVGDVSIYGVFVADIVLSGSATIISPAITALSANDVISEANGSFTYYLDHMDYVDTKHHKIIIIGANSAGVDHKGFFTIQPHKTIGSHATPCNINLDIYVDCTLADGEYLDLATIGKTTSGEIFVPLDSDDTSLWDPVLVRLKSDGFLYLMNVPALGGETRITQTTTETFPQKEWVPVRIYVNFDAVTGYVKVWQDGVLVSHALVSGGTGILPQYHFGVVAPYSVSRAIIKNRTLTVEEVVSE